MSRKFIDLKEDEAKAIKEVYDEYMAYDRLVLRTAKLSSKKQILMWDLIMDFYPEMQGHSASYHSVLNKISYRLEKDDLTEVARDVAELRILRKLSEAGFDRKKLIEALSEE